MAPRLAVFLEITVGLSILLDFGGEMNTAWLKKWILGSDSEALALPAFWIMVKPFESAQNLRRVLRLLDRYILCKLVIKGV